MLIILISDSQIIVHIIVQVFVVQPTPLILGHLFTSTSTTLHGCNVQSYE